MTTEREEIEKREAELYASLMKSNEGLVDVRKRAFDGRVAEIAKTLKLETPMATRIALESDAEGQRAYAELVEAQQKYELGDIGPVVAKYDADRATLDGEIATQLEAFGVAHNLEKSAAQERLVAVSPTFAALVEKRHQLEQDRAMALVKVEQMTAEWHATKRVAANRAQREELAKSAEAANPIQKQLDARVRAYAVEKGIPVAKATEAALFNDPETQRLYAELHVYAKGA